MMQILYKLPEELRPRLAKAHTFFDAEVLYGDREGVAQILRARTYLELHRCYIVGDFVCQTFIEYIGIPHMCIVDGKTLRTSIRMIQTKIFDEVLRCRNPPGTISNECIEVIRKCYKAMKRFIIVVEGEEDLLGLAILTIVDRGFLIYGVPNEGVAIIDIEKNFIKALDIFSRFEKIYYSS